jgi:hypothetical protein
MLSRRNERGASPGNKADGSLDHLSVVIVGFDRQYGLDIDQWILYTPELQV